MKKLFLLFVIIIPMVSSCQEHLSREYAKKVIIERRNYPIPYTYEITKSFIKDMQSSGRGVSIVLGEDEFKEKEQVIYQFESAGLIQLKKTPKREESTAFLLGTNVRTWTQVNVSLTEAGRKYLVEENEGLYVVRLWEIDLKEITGIQEFTEQKIASVDYTIFNKNITPFGTIFSDKNDIDRKSASFSLYDDGWRIQ
ncbi:MAG: hypothetical protein A2W90_04920 [Bacteroidetes bacterium GWF2_42_66]|nr:MAG: hypothetical protein A2W89_21140 [Bacteroidetes bacterium GWE2_42_39]OFY40827.1 MAG: hypothetical protein A2W90_04920 [Bacteroidetes bacterium GWF2_42_66]HAZ00598.1 hypothetical protein [Marinilabiliales bacterium]HBL75848.1 hypothetical protein [Prolixibacteraceae bacterium]HCU63097.1 hypothetical protein [Prolixibacteraceae bacterium]